MSSRFSQHDSRNSITSEYLTFSRDIRKFINTCREDQTLFVNLEGQFEKRCFKHNEHDSLINYVSETMSTTQCTGQNPLKLANKILSFKSPDGDVYCSNFWLYYYEYEGKSTRCIPLFKIFRGKETDDFFILDPKSVFYNNFDNFLDTIELPLSFICVPRNGRYDFVDGKLNLEFISSNKNLNAVTHFAPYTTYSQRISRYFSNINWSSVVKTVMPIALNFITVLEDMNCTLGSKLTFLKLITTFFTHNNNTSLSGIGFDNDALMLCNVRKEAIDPKTLLKQRKEVTKLADSLLHLAETPKGHWKQTFRGIFEITLQVTGEIPDELFHIFISHPWIHWIFIIIQIAKILAHIGIKMVDHYESLPDKNHSREVKFPHNPCRRTVNYEAAMQNLSQLSIMDSPTFENLYTEESTPATEAHIEIFSPKSGFHFLGVDDGAAFFIIVRAAPAHINYYAHMLNALIKPDGPNRSKIVRENPKGNKDIGALYYSSDLLVVGFIEEEELPEGVNVRDRIKRENKGLSGLSLGNY